MTHSRNVGVAVFLAGLLLCCSTAQSAWWNSSYTKTRNPIVLVHGLFGFDQAFGLYDYFYRIPGALEDGGATVYIADVSAANSSELRGEQLIEQLDTLRALYGHARFNLIGHSHGAPTVRYAASVRPDLVASVTSVGGPNAGSPVADAVRTVAPPGSSLEAMLAALTNALAVFIEAISGGTGDPQDVVDALDALTSDGAAAFNANYPEGMPVTSCGEGASVVNGIRYYSFSGTGVFRNALDPADYALAATSVFFFGSANDGLVGRCSSHLGDVLRDNYPWNHGDEVNQVLGLRGLFTPNPTSVYRAHANRLKNRGL